MKKITFNFFLFLIFVNIYLPAQKLRSIRGVVIDDNKNPVKNFTLRFSTIGEVVTTQTGEFIMEVPDNISYLELSVDDTLWSILYPLDYKIPIPSDPNFVTKIVLTRLSNNNEKIDDVVKEYKKLKDLLTEIGIQQNELKNLYETFVENESERTELDSENLRSAIQRSIKREEIFPEVSSLLANYNLKVQNLNSFYQNESEFAFVDTMANKELMNAINNYNEVFRKLYNDKASMENNIHLYWNNQLEEKFSELLDYIFDEIHSPCILKFNPINTKMNRLVRGYITDDDEIIKTKNELKSSIQQITNDLDIKLPILQRRTNDLITRLQSAGYE